MYSTEYSSSIPDDSVYAPLSINYPFNTNYRTKLQTQNWFTGYVVPIENNSAEGTLPTLWDNYIRQYRFYTVTASSCTVTAFPSTQPYAFCIMPWVPVRNIGDFREMIEDSNTVWAYVSTTDEPVVLKNYKSASQVFGMDYGKDIKQHSVEVGENGPVSVPNIDNEWAWIICYKFFASADIDDTPRPVNMGIDYTFYTRWFGRRSPVIVPDYY